MEDAGAINALVYLSIFALLFDEMKRATIPHLVYVGDGSSFLEMTREYIQTILLTYIPRFGWERFEEMMREVPRQPTPSLEKLFETREAYMLDVGDSADHWRIPKYPVLWVRHPVWMLSKQGDMFVCLYVMDSSLHMTESRIWFESADVLRRVFERKWRKNPKVLQWCIYKDETYQCSSDAEINRTCRRLYSVRAPPTGYRYEVVCIGERFVPE